MLELSEWTERFKYNSLINADGGGCSTFKSGNQPLRLKFLRISGSSSSKMTLRSAQTDLKILSFSSLPNHAAKGLKERKTKTKKRTKGRLH